MVVGAVVEVLLAVGLQRPVQINGGGPGGEIELVDHRPLVRRGRSRGEAVPPYLGGGGDEAEVHRHGHVAHQSVQMARILLQLFGVGVLHPVDESVLLSEIDPLVLLLAGQPLAPGLGGYPEVPAHDVVGDILLRVCHKLPAAQALCRQLGRLLQEAVFQRGEILVRQQQADDAHAPDEGAEQNGQKNVELF